MFAAEVEVKYSAVLSAGIIPVRENEAGSSEGCTKVLCRFERQVRFSSLIPMHVHRTLL